MDNVSVKPIQIDSTFQMVTIDAKTIISSGRAGYSYTQNIVMSKTNNIFYVITVYCAICVLLTDGNSVNLLGIRKLNIPYYVLK